jgi:ABC-type antimicrobial peptide transport system permease subunit
MKNNLGKIIKFILVFFTVSLLHAQQGFITNVMLDKKSAYIKEAVILTFDINQTDYSKVMFFDFTLAKSSDYEFHRLGVKEEGTYQNAQIHYTYLLYPLKSGEISIGFELIQKITTKQNVAYSFSGDRDNVKGMTMTDIPITLEPIKLQVKPLPKNTLLVGEFSLSHTIKTHEAKAYEPLPVTIEIKGKGYLPKLDEIIKPSENYTLFKEEPQITSIKSNKTMLHMVTYHLALSAKKSFSLPAIQLKTFNPAKKQSYTLKIPKQDFKIAQVPSETLVDQTDLPMPLQKTDWSWLTTLLGYIVVFIAGFLTAKSVQWQRKEKVKADPFSVQVAQTDDPKALLTLLMAEDSKKYADIIEKLDAHIYGKKPLNLKEIKKELNV